MVADGQLGEIRLVQVEYVQGGKAAESDPDPDGPLPWRYDPVRGGPSLVMGDIGTHAHNLVRFVTGLEVSERRRRGGPHRAQSARRRLRRCAAAIRQRRTRFVLGHPGGRGRRELPAAPSLWSPRDPRMDAGGADAADFPTAGRARRDPHAERAGNAAAGGAGEPDRRGSPRGVPRRVRQPVLRRRRGDRRHDGPAWRPTRWRCTFPTADDGYRGVAFVEATIASSEADGAWTPVG